MQVGMGVIFQATDPKRTDRDVYKAELALGDLAEPLGFDSIWGVEHHFTDYTMCPDVLQYLSYYAGRTTKVKLGSMVVVLPWHDPMRVAEQIAVLDQQSDGRFIFGMGRGLGRVEFDGFGVDQNTARERFVESAQMLLEGLERGWCEFDGKFIQQAKRDIRPRPFKTFKGRTYAAAVSPESSEIMARLGVGLLIIPQKPWEAVFTEMANYRAIYREVNKADAPPPILAGWVFCDKDAKKAEAMAREYIGGYWQTVLKHYELAGDHLTKTKGYESYGAMQQMVRGGGADAMIDFFLGLQIWGTPDQCAERIVDFTNKLGAETFTGVFSYAGMPYDMAEKSLRLFASDVLPRLKAHERVKAAAEVAMATRADVKTIAQALDGVSEVDHFGRPSWRTKKRIFAVMRPDGLFVHLPEERKEFLFEADPKVFVKFMWGKRSNVIVQIDKISKKELEALIREAWEMNRVVAKAKTASARRPAAPRGKRARS